ncbi:MAG TPA: alpha/beta fold hydrolase [Candidatus Baltobacteraceae bacterium]|jgi:hypothetical protein
MNTLTTFALVACCALIQPAVARGSEASSRDLSFTSSDGSVLSATISWPAQASARAPAVVLLHDGGPEDRDETIGPNKIFAQIAEALNSAGFAVLRYDKRAIGKSTSKTPISNVVRQNYLDDAEAAVDAVASDSHVDPQRLYLLGHSEGGELALGVALSGAKVRGLVLLAPLPLSYQAIIEAQLARQDQSPAVVSQLRLAERLPFIKSYARVNPPAEIAAVEQPVLVVHGSKDVQITDADIAPLVEAGKKKSNFTDIELAPDNHLFFALTGDEVSTGQEYLQSHPLDPALMQAVVGWLRAH